jgi:hypothetical protein
MARTGPMYIESIEQRSDMWRAWQYNLMAHDRMSFAKLVWTQRVELLTAKGGGGIWFDAMTSKPVPIEDVRKLFRRVETKNG